MIAFAVVPLLFGLCLYRGAPWLAERCLPRWAARSLVVLGLCSALASGLVLCAVACLGMAELSWLGRVGGWSAGTLSHRDDVPVPLAVVASVVAAVLIVASVVQLVRTVRRLVAANRTARVLGPGHEGLVIVDDVHAGAYALPALGAGGRTVVSRRLLQALDAPERRALLAHESSHLRHRHFLYVQLAELAAAANPLLRPTARAVRRAVEQWADDDAVAAVGDPVAVARALAKASMASAGAPSASLAMASETELASRVANLLTPRRRSTGRAVTLMAGVAVVCAISSASVALVAHADFEVAQSRFVGQASI